MKRKTYEGPKLEFILGEELPVVDSSEPQRAEKEVVSSAHSKQEES
jgi:choline transport protein